MGPLEHYYTQQTIYLAAVGAGGTQVQKYAVRALMAREVENYACDRITRKNRIARLRQRYLGYTSQANVPG